MNKSVVIDGVNFYLDGMRFYQRIGDSESELIRDFSEDLPMATEIHHDSEGEEFMGRDRWSFMATHHNGNDHEIDGFLAYRISDEALYVRYPIKVEADYFNEPPVALDTGL